MRAMRFIVQQLTWGPVTAVQRGLTGWIACDPLAVAVAIRPELIEEAEELYCAVELHGSLTRGMSTFDWNKTLGREPNVALVRKVNLEGFNAMMDASTG